MNFITRIMLCFIFILLAGCAHYDAFMKRSHEQAGCKASCQHRLMLCTKTCHNSCAECCLVANQRAASDYSHYIERKNIQGENGVRRLNSYRDLLQCRKTTCECPTDYRICIQSCSGKIPKRLQVAPAC